MTWYIDWCCFYYFVRLSLVALLEALCARFCLSLSRRFLSPAKLHLNAIHWCAVLPILSCILWFGVLAVHCLRKPKYLVPSITKTWQWCISATGSLTYSLPVVVLVSCLNFSCTAVHILRHARTPTFFACAPQVQCHTHLLQYSQLVHAALILWFVCSWSRSLSLLISCSILCLFMLSWLCGLYVRGLGLCPFNTYLV